MIEKSLETILRMLCIKLLIDITMTRYYNKEVILKIY